MTATTEPRAGASGRTDPVPRPLPSPNGSPVLGSSQPTDSPHPVLDLVIPVYNEERALEASVRAAHRYIRTELPFPARLTIADNASTDATLRVARGLARELPGLRVVHLDAKGRGRALQAAWGSSDAQVLAYMDVDLSTDLAALLPLVAPLVSGHSEVAIGSRLRRDSHVARGPKREFISRTYNTILRGALGAHFSDAQCGFKAIRADAARELLPLVEDTSWFFDTELLVLAEKAGLRIHEVPVDWQDDPDSRVDIVSTATDDLRGVWRLMRGLSKGCLPLDAVAAALPHRRAVPIAGGAYGSEDAARPSLFTQLVRFAVVGVICTIAYALLYLVLRHGVGAQWANFLALLLTAVLNTGLNRRHTFGVTGPGVVRQQGQGLIVFGLGWALTAGSLALLHATAPGAGHYLELAVLMTANVCATVLRFVLLRSWVFRPKSASHAGQSGTTEGTSR